METSSYDQAEPKEYNYFINLVELPSEFHFVQNY